MKHGKWTWLSWILVGIILLAALIEFVLWLLQQTGPSSFDSWVTALGHGIYGLVLGGLFVRNAT